MKKWPLTNSLNNFMKQSLSDFLNIVLILILTIVMWGGMYYIVSTLPQKYDCSIAENSPDIPLDTKDKCRKIRMIKE